MINLIQKIKARRQRKIWDAELVAKDERNREIMEKLAGLK